MSCVIHQIQHSLKYVSWKDRKAFAASLRAIYQAPTLEQAEASLRQLAEDWSEKYAIAVKSWKNNWDDSKTGSRSSMGVTVYTQYWILPPFLGLTLSLILSINQCRVV